MSTRALEILNRWTLFAQYCLLPGTCVVCHQPSGRQLDLCPACADALVQVLDPCAGCGLPLPPGRGDVTRCGACLARRRPIVRTIAPLAWKPPVVQLVSGYKYAEQLQYGRVLGTVLIASIEAGMDRADLPQLLVPVPLHPRRLRDRGYNQALLLARQLGRHFGIPVSHTIASRVLDTTPQQGLSAVQRRRNLRGAFAVEACALPFEVTRIALVDDVITTMSTLTTLARELHRHLPGPLEIQAWALARA